MGQHPHHTVCLAVVALLTLIVTAQAQWRNWDAGPRVALEDLAQALAERLETTWTETVIETNELYVCGGTKSYVTTNRHYGVAMASPAWAGPNVGYNSPIQYTTMERVLRSDNLIHYSDATQAVVVVTNGIATTNLVVEPLYRMDDLYVTTNQDCSVVTQDMVAVTYTGAPSPFASHEWLGYYDDALYRLIVSPGQLFGQRNAGSGTWVLEQTPAQLYPTITTNWHWFETTGKWEPPGKRKSRPQ